MIIGSQMMGTTSDTTTRSDHTSDSKRGGVCIYYKEHTLLNIYQNYIPNKKIKCGCCPPPWMVDIIKKSLKEISKSTKLFIILQKWSKKN